MTRIGKYIAGMMMANARGNAAKRPMPPITSHVSLPSQIGATVFMMSVRASSSAANGDRMPTPEVEAVEQDVHEHGERRGSASRSGTRSMAMA